MPREQINYVILDQQAWTNQDGTYPQNNNVLGGPWRDPALHVSWHAEDEHSTGHVQVAFEADPAYLKFGAEHPNEDRERSSVWSPVLTRADINKLIRTLKRARDQAYGRDE